MNLTTCMTKAQKTKVIEGFNFECATGKGQYKYRNGSYAMEGSDVARRFNLLSTIVTGKPITIESVTLDNFDRVVLMQDITDEFFQMSFKKVPVEESNKFGQAALARFTQ